MKSKNAFSLILVATFMVALTSCLNNGNIISQDLANSLPLNPGPKDPTDPKNPTPTPTNTPTPTPSPGNGNGNGAGTAPGCNATPGILCEGGFDSDNSPKSLKVKVVYGNPAGSRLTNDPINHARNFISSVNTNYIHQGHRHMNLQLDESKVLEVTQESDSTMINKYAEAGYVTMILVANIPGSTVGYVQHMCARLQNKEAWTIFEFPYVANGVVEHEVNHLFCFPHTSSQNGGNPNTFLSGYNNISTILSRINALKIPFSPDFKLYVDGLNRSNASVTHDNMVYFTGNLMYYSVLPNRPKLFTNHGEGYPYSYSHLLDYYYWNFIKPHAK